MKKSGDGKSCVRKLRKCKKSKSEFDFKGSVSTVRFPLVEEVSQAIAVSGKFHGDKFSVIIRSALVDWMCNVNRASYVKIGCLEDCQSRICEMIGEYENGIDDVPVVVLDVPISLYEDLKRLGLILGGVSADEAALAVIVHMLDM